MLNEDWKVEDIEKAIEEQTEKFEAYNRSVEDIIFGKVNVREQLLKLINSNVDSITSEDIMYRAKSPYTADEFSALTGALMTFGLLSNKIYNRAEVGDCHFTTNTVAVKFEDKYIVAEEMYGQGTLCSLVVEKEKPYTFFELESFEANAEHLYNRANEGSEEKKSELTLEIIEKLEKQMESIQCLITQTKDQDLINQLESIAKDIKEIINNLE